MGLFTKICAIPAFLVGLALLVVGLIGLFMPLSFRLNISIPSVYGAAFMLLGWGILRPITLAWRKASQSASGKAQVSEMTELLS